MVDVLLGAAVSAVIFVAMISFSSQLTTFMVGPGFIQESGQSFALTPSRMEGSKKGRILSRMGPMRSQSRSILLVDGAIAESWFTVDGRLTLSSLPIYSFSPGVLVDPAALRTLLSADGASFSSGFTVFFLGDEARIRGILRVSSSDSSTHRLFTVSLSIEQSVNENLRYQFAEPLTLAQSAPGYASVNFTSGLDPFFEARLPDPEDNFVARQARLQGVTSITRNGIDGIPVVFPIFP